MSFDKLASMDSKEELYQLLLEQIRESRLADAASSYTKKDSLVLSDVAKDYAAQQSANEHTKNGNDGSIQF
jgi:hypothetical protein